MTTTSDYGWVITYGYLVVCTLASASGVASIATGDTVFGLGLVATGVFAGVMWTGFDLTVRRWISRLRSSTTTTYTEHPDETNETAVYACPTCATAVAEGHTLVPECAVEMKRGDRVVFTGVLDLRVCQDCGTVFDEQFATQIDQ